MIPLVRREAGMRTLYRDDLAPGRCQAPGCDHTHDDELVMNARCHPRAGVEVIYHKETGIAEMRCKRCRKDVAALQVAWRTPGAGLQWPADPRAG